MMLCLSAAKNVNVRSTKQANKQMIGREVKVQCKDDKEDNDKEGNDKMMMLMMMIMVAKLS